MVKSVIKATVFFKHEQREIAALADAIIPMADSIRAVSNSSERSRMRAILGGEYFRIKEAERMRYMLIRAARYAKAHLDEYFELMRDQVLYDATHLENTLDWYWNTLRETVNEVEPRH
jgi:hypothetical protein